MKPLKADGFTLDELPKIASEELDLRVLTWPRRIWPASTPPTWKKSAPLRKKPPASSQT